MRALWLIDGSYMYKAMKNYQKTHTEFSNRGVDYKKLKAELIKAFGVDRLDCFYFNSTPDPAADGQNQFHSWLKSSEPNGPNIRVKLYDLKNKTTYCKSCDENTIVKVQKGVDVGIATTALKLYDKYQTIILSAGDGDFEDFIQFLVEDKDLQLFIAGFNGSISPDIQQYSSSVYLIDDHYSDICDTRMDKPFETVDEVSDIT